MAANRTEGAKSEAPAEAAASNNGASHPAAPSPIQAWLPLIVALVVLPVAAYLITSFILLPKLQRGLGVAPAAAAAAAPAKEKESGGHGKEAKEGKEGKEGGAAKEKESGGHGAKEGGHGAAEEGSSNGREQVAMSKLVVNVAGTQASRILLATAILVGATSEFRGAVKEKDAQLRDTACGILGTKTIQDLERPGARNVIRSELITAFNHVLGDGAVQEIYFTEFAVQ